MPENLLYEERLTSGRTQALFLGLAALCGGLSACRARAGRRGRRAAVALGVGAAFFGFYALNYRTLGIQLTPSTLKLTFGLFCWRVPLDNVASCGLDDLPPLLRYGGAGLHFMFVRQRYRASFNFLEYPRLVIALCRPIGPVRDISFSTRQPEGWCRLIAAARQHLHS
jgi:hypothetical protein